MSPKAVALHIYSHSLLPLHHLKAYKIFLCIVFRIMFVKDSKLRDKSKGFCDNQDLQSSLYYILE